MIMEQALKEKDWFEKKVETESFLLIKYGTRKKEIAIKELELVQADDLSNYINAIVKEHYHEIFGDSEINEGICFVEYEGIEVRAKKVTGEILLSAA